MAAQDMKKKPKSAHEPRKRIKAELRSVDCMPITFRCDRNDDNGRKRKKHLPRLF